MRIKCLVVDDEKLAQEVLIHHISKFDTLQLEGVCSNVFELISFLNKNSDIDLIFLDIKMPEISGTDFVEMFKNPPAIIYTTAYNQYAVDAFNQDALDYLLKPISLERFSKSVQKTGKILLAKQNPMPTKRELEDDTFYVKSDKRLVKIDPKKLFFIEGMGNYVCLHTDNDKIILHSTLSAMEENIKNLNYICRVHKSFFINLNKIKHLEQNVAVLTNEKNIPIGLSYRDQFYLKFKIV